MYRVSYMCGGAGFLPSTVSCMSYHLCVGFSLKGGGRLGDAFDPLGLKITSEKTVRFFQWRPVKVCHQKGLEFYTNPGVLSYTFFANDHCSSLSGCQETLVKDLVLRAQQQGPRKRCLKMYIIDIHWYAKRGWTLNVFLLENVFFTLQGSNLYYPGRQAAEAHILAKDVVLQAQQRGRQVGPTWTIIESWSFPGFIADKRNASDQSQTQDGQWQEIWKNLQITGGFMWATIWGSYW